MVVLGEWNREYHVEQYQTNLATARKPKSVTHFYKDGEMCEETGSKRQVKVKMICSRKLDGQGVAIGLEEPKTCQYVLKVESKLFCDLLDSLDDNGLFDV